MGGGFSGHLGTRAQKARAAACPLELSDSFHERPIENRAKFPAGPQGPLGQ